MRKTLLAALIVSLGVAGQAYAQKLKQTSLNFSLTRQYESSTNFSSTRLQWKTRTAKVSNASILSSISAVTGQAFSSKALIVLAGGELSGFYGAWPDILGQTVVSLPNGFNRAVIDTNLVEVYETLWPAGLWQPAMDRTGEMMQDILPLAQVYVQDGDACYNVSPFFYITVQECYDCFYLNSFVTDTTFTLGKQEGPPCCSPTLTLNGSGRDKYYMTLAFDNTVSNPAFWDETTETGYLEGYVPLNPEEDGITPNVRPITKGRDVQTMRFRLNGILEYSWSLKMFNSGDPYPQFLGSAKYACTGYGFIAKTCCMITGNVSVSEKLVTTPVCGVWDDLPVYDIENRPTFYGTEWPLFLYEE